MKALTIGKVAQLAGVGVETVRFYEREGLIDQPKKKFSGYRDYPSKVIDRIRFIKRAQDLGFALKDVADLLDLSLKPEAACEDVKSRAQIKIKEVENKIQTLLRMKNALRKLILACSGRGSTTECPILEALNEKEAI